MNVQQLIDLLSQFPADMQVKFATGMFGGDLDTRHIGLLTNKDDTSVVIDLDK